MKAEDELDIKLKSEMGRGTPGRRNSVCGGPRVSESDVMWLEDGEVVEKMGNGKLAVP